MIFACRACYASEMGSTSTEHAISRGIRNDDTTPRNESSSALDDDERANTW